MTQTITDQRQPNQLRPHPLNEEIYADRADGDLIESVRSKGVLNPILITKDDLIISGHRRWGAAIAAGLTTVPVVITPIDDPLAIEEALIESNRQRQKSNEQIGREYKRLKHIYNERQSRQGKRSDLTSGSREPEVKPTERAAAELGVSKPTAVRIEAVVDHIDQLHANGKTDEAEHLRQELNRSANAAYNTVRQSDVGVLRTLTVAETVAHINKTIAAAPEHQRNTSTGILQFLSINRHLVDYRWDLPPNTKLGGDEFLQAIALVRKEIERRVNNAETHPPHPSPTSHLPTQTYQVADQGITETIDAAVRRATCVYTGDHERWQALKATGADYWQILDLLKSIITSPSGSSAPGGYSIECRRGPIITIRKGIDGPVVANLMSGVLVTAVRRAWAIPETKAETQPLVPAENTVAEPVEPTASVVRLLTPTETEAVIWRAVQHSGHTAPADQLAWFQTATEDDFRKLLKPGVNFAGAIFNDAYNHVHAQLRRQSQTIVPAQPTTITTNTAVELVWAALSADTFPPPLLPAKIKFLKTTPFAIFKSFLAKGETVTDETMLAALGKVEASLTLQMETCAHHFVDTNNHCTICGQPSPIPSHSSDPSQPTPAEPIDAQPTEEKPDGDEYYTPPYIIEAARQVLGDIDLDPASSSLAQTVVNAKRYYTKEDDGLTKPWTGTVWHNPPYSRPAPFVAKLIAEYEAGNITAAILLVNTGTETQWGQSLLTRYPVCFVGAHGERRSRISFWREDPTQPDNRNRYSQMIFYLGNQPDRFAAVFQQFGAILEVKRC